MRDFRPRGFKWVKAATAIASGATNAEAAKAADVTISAVTHWRKHPRFRALLQRYLDRVEQEAVSTGLALRHVRMRKIGRHAARIETRLDPSVIDGQPEAGPDIAEFTALSREYRATIELAAKEMGGQFEDAIPGERNAGVSVVFNFPVATQEQLDAVNNAPVIDLPPMARRLLQRPSDGAQR
ncbi:MAG: hypothetical protein M3O20_15130 [Acidobacteriota bacterium]|nr:hypothetical protein [Acidobacteriota bacterium]